MLYVVDSVTRRWLDQAKQQGQTVNSSAVDGTYAAGVHRVTELIPVLMNDIAQSAPAEQKVRYITDSSSCTRRSAAGSLVEENDDYQSPPGDAGGCRRGHARLLARAGRASYPFGHFGPIPNHVAL